MAAKKPVAKKSAAAVQKSKTSKGKSTYTAAQRSAYQKASKSAIQNAQLHHSATALQQRRLQAVTRVRAKLAAKGAQLYAARIKTNAVGQTYRQIAQAHQSKFLRVAAAKHLFKAQSLETNRQFAYSGEAIHARTTTLQTLTDRQALAAQIATSSAARKKAAASLAGKRVAAGSKKAKAKTSKSPYTAIGAAAGRAAAAKVSRSAVVSSPTKTQPSKARKAAKLDPVDNPKWITAGNDEGKENCVMVAIANHCLLHTGHKVSVATINYMGMYNATTIASALGRVDNADGFHPAGLSEYGMVKPEDAKPGMIVGFDTFNGAHCGVLMEDNTVVSWGEVVPLEAEIDEAWEVIWTLTTRG